MWEVFPPPDTYEIEKIQKKKGKTKSVLDDEDNADKIITDLAGRHTFGNFQPGDHHPQEE